MNQQEALNILLQAVEIANKRGAYSLQESKQIALAAEAFQQKEPATSNIKKTEAEG
jgi:hypothetical protein